MAADNTISVDQRRYAVAFLRFTFMILTTDCVANTGNAYWRNIADAKPARKMIEEVIKKELEETRLFPAEMLNLYVGSRTRCLVETTANHSTSRGRSLPYGPGREWVMWRWVIFISA